MRSLDSLDFVTFADRHQSAFFSEIERVKMQLKEEAAARQRFQDEAESKVCLLSVHPSVPADIRLTQPPPFGTDFRGLDDAKGAGRA